MLFNDIVLKGILKRMGMASFGNSSWAKKKMPEAIHQFLLKKRLITSPQYIGEKI